MALSERSYLNAYLGFGVRTNENHGHLLGGVKVSFDGHWTVGVQMDGHRTSPFASYSFGAASAGLYLIGGEIPAWMLSVRY